jgi:hypothetical protein
LPIGNSLKINHLVQLTKLKPLVLNIKDMTQTLLKYSLVALLVLAFNTTVFAQEGIVTIDQDQDITTLLEFKKDLKTVELYKIQVYQGNRNTAESAKSNFSNTYKEWPVEMVFETPNYKIWAGNFRSRLEADKALLKLKTNSMNAFIFQPKKDNN